MSGALFQSGDNRALAIHYTNGGANATGLTVTVWVLRLRAGAWSEIVTAGAAAEVGRGLYWYDLAAANLQDGDVVAWVADTAGTVDQRNLAGIAFIEGNFTAARAAALDNLDAAVSTRSDFDETANPVIVGSTSAGAITAASFAANALDAVWSAATRTLTSFGTLVAQITAAIGGANVTRRSPVVDTDFVDIVAFDDYKIANGRALRFPVPQIDLTGATAITFAIDIDGTVSEIGTGTIANPGDLENQEMVFELTAAETGSLQPTKRKARGLFQARATLGTNVLTQYEGAITVRRGLREPV